MLGSTSESRRRSKKDKDPDRERSSPKSKDKDRDRDRHKSSKSSRSSGTARKTRSSTSKDDDTERDRTRDAASRERTSSTTSVPKNLSVVPEMDRRGSLGMGSANGSRSSLSYPTLSKTHAKENIYSRAATAADPVERKRSPFTPNATDAGDDTNDNEKEKTSPPAPTRAPPSPPLTATNGADLRKTASANSMRRNNPETIQKEMEAGRRSVESGTRLTPEPRGLSRSSVRDGEVDGTDMTSTTSSQPSTIRAKSPKVAPTKTKSAGTSSVRTSRRSTPVKVKSRQASVVTQSTGSDATSVPPQYQPSRKVVDTSPTNSEVSPASIIDSSPRTPTQHSVLPSVISAQKVPRPPTVEIVSDPLSRAQSTDSAYTQQSSTPPPPPPPPALGLVDPPRVDYLLQNGGLTRPVPRTLLAAMEGTPVTGYSQYMSPRVSGPQSHDARAFFNPLQKLLDDYNAVIDTNGSLAVATGYRSVARRLLDRLEAVFARNISSEYCGCLMCLDQPIHEDAAGVNWGEILELVSGRCDLPNWPPVDEGAKGLGIGSSLEDPCQRIDVDVPEQYREHYAQQSRKTKVAVQSWLSSQQEGVPEDADDETLTFAMLTRLEQHQRPLFYAILYGLEELPNPRTKPENTATPPYLAKAGLALQRLYRLYSPPRNQLVVMYLIRNPDMHNTLATLSAVTKHEWEILVSGRFDGFLWSGAETALGEIPPTDGPQRFASPFSAQTPFSPFSPGPSPRPGSARPGSTRPGSTRPPGGPAPVQIDEDTEVAVLAEVEREIYLGMEAMEDAFEALHLAAENVRRRLRERGAALSMVAQARGGVHAGGIEVRTGTPASMRGDADEGLDDLRSEIGPDDSASNVSHNRKRRGHRARERRTPAPERVEEVDEGQAGAGSSLAERVRRKY
ncbi:unnamed protein product [Periconia digitata]|uniref:Uncharacterized protein n=1 Tax=Periconia digitata TaxID=1303443 RepID=A0A9W4USZ0_9PLEO|nr:unnamed protein product [Periconia digitata]